MQKFSELMRGNELIVAPVGLDPIMARLAEEVSHDGLGEVSQLTAIGQILTAGTPGLTLAHLPR